MPKDSKFNEQKFYLRMEEVREKIEKHFGQLYGQIDIRILTIEQIQFLKDVLIWGTYGLDGLQPLKVILLKDADTDHLEMILYTQSDISPIFRKVIHCILMERQQEKWVKSLSQFTT